MVPYGVFRESLRFFFTEDFAVFFVFVIDLTNEDSSSDDEEL